MNEDNSPHSGMTGAERDRLTRLETEVATLLSGTNEIRMDLKLVLSRMDSASGGWKMLISLLATAGALGALLMSLANHLKWM